VPDFLFFSLGWGYWKANLLEQSFGLGLLAINMLKQLLCWVHILKNN
jgi:hypothetical protein